MPMHMYACSHFGPNEPSESARPMASSGHRYPTSRAPKPRVVHFVPDDLIKDWSELLNLRQPGFKWDGSSGVDLDMRARLAVNAAPLMQILKHAPSGFPAHGDLANVFASLQASHGIVDESKKPMPKACTDAAETWRLLAKEVYKLKKNGEQCAPIQDLIDSIVLPSSQSASIHSDIVEDTTICGLTAP